MKGWTESEIERKRLVESGLTVVADCHKGGHDERLVEWSQETNRFVYIGRRNWHYPASIWGNPTIRKDDTKADRDRVCEAFARHLESRPDLLAGIPELKGKVLGCWCHPKRCHGDLLAALANEFGGVKDN